MNKSAQTYMRQFLLAMLGYVVLLIASIYLLPRVPAGAPRILLAVLPVIPVLFAVAAYIRFLGGLDELQQRIQLQALAFAFAATGLLTFTYGFLQNAGLPPLSWIWIFPAMIALWGIGAALAGRKYQ